MSAKSAYPSRQVEFYYFPRGPRRPRAKTPQLLEVVFFNDKPRADLRFAKGEIVALFVYSQDAVEWATRRRGEIQVFVNSEGEVEAVFALAETATPDSEKTIHFSLPNTGQAFTSSLWGIVVRPSRTRLAPQDKRFESLEL